QSQVLAAGLRVQPVIAQSKNWSVRRETDPMTDKPSCTGLYKDRFDIQLSSKALNIDMRKKGGIKGIKLRYDDEPAQQLRLASDAEKEVSVVDITGPEFRKLLSAKRLRVQILTFLSSVQEEDINLDGLVEMYNIVMSAQCEQ